MKILVPIDLNDASKAVYDYALQFAERIEANVTLLHIINSVYNTSDIIGYDPYVEMEKAAKKRLSEFTSTSSDQGDVLVKNVHTFTDVVFGIPGIAIAEYAESKGFDMIIMGVRDKHGFFDRILGSASTETIKEANCPVILVHQETQFKNPEKILFAFDKKTDLDDALEDFKKLNDVLKAKTDFLHINVKQTDDITEQKSEIVEELFEKEDPSFAFEVKTLSGKNVLSGLNDYCYFEKIDLVAMIHRSEGIFSRFLHRDKSIKLAQEFHLPVMVLQED